MLKLLLKIMSGMNVAGGVVLLATWAANAARVPVVVLFIGSALLVQGGFTLLYASGGLTAWGDVATGALFAGEGLAACVGAGLLFEGIAHNMQTADMEMAPVLAGLLMVLQALLALLYLFLAHKLRPGINSGHSA